MHRAVLRAAIGRAALSTLTRSSAPLTLRGRVFSLTGTSVRYAHSAAARRPPDEFYDEDEFDAATDQVSAEATDLGTVPYSTLQPHVSSETYTALTVRPMQLKTMTPVQSEVLALMPGLAAPDSEFEPDRAAQAARQDLLIQAKTGTGKTLAFLIPAIEQRIRTLEAVRQQALADNSGAGPEVAERAVRAFAGDSLGTLIISPTRELATQIANEAIRAAAHHRGFEVRLMVGGVSKGNQMREWTRGRRDILVATPGRLLDMLNSEPDVARGVRKAQLLVLDEADTLLDMGFREDIERIREFLPPAPKRQTFLCSATISTAIKQVTAAFMRPNHKFIKTVSADTSPVHAHIPQYHTVLPNAGEQLPHLMRLVAHDQMINGGRSKVIVFLPTTKKTQLLSTIFREMSRENLPAKKTMIYELHSKRAQESRTHTADAFRNDKSGASVLVTSDVSARGVDYPGVTRVIQVGIPASSEVYIHRVGRTGRAGTSGRGDLVLLPWEIGFVTWQLTEVPMKPLTVNELKNQLAELAPDFEANPHKYVTPPAPAPVEESRKKIQVFNRNGKPDFTPYPVSFPRGVVERINGIAAALDTLKTRLDEEAINETFASMLGYYIAKSPELRVNKEIVVEGCKAWAVEAGGLPAPPYVSAGFLAKMGFGDGRTKKFGRSQYSDRLSDRTDRSAPWLNRGQFGAWNRESKGGVAARSQGWDVRGPVSNPENYMGRRYGARRSY